MTNTADLANNLIATDDDGYCIHDLDVLTCAICRAAAGFRPGTDAFNNDCSVASFVEITGVDYGDAVELMADAVDYRPGRGLNARKAVEVYTTMGYTATPVDPFAAARTTTGRYLFVGYRGRKGHAFTRIDGTNNRVGRYLSPGSKVAAFRIDD